MNSTYLTDPVIFVIDTLFSLYILAVVLRFLLQWNRAELYNPIYKFLVNITQPALKILRRYIPSMGAIDTSSIVLALVLQMLANLAILLLKGFSVSIGALTLLAVSDLTALLLNIFIYAVIAQAVLSWFTPGDFSPASSLLHTLTEPFLDTCRKFVPYIGGVDMSPLIALMILQLTKMDLLPPLQKLAVWLG